MALKPGATNLSDLNEQVADDNLAAGAAKSAEAKEKKDKVTAAQKGKDWVEPVSSADAVKAMTGGKNVILRHPLTGSLTRMIQIGGRYHKPENFTNLGANGGFIPTTSGMSKTDAHLYVGLPHKEGDFDNEQEMRSSDLRRTDSLRRILNTRTMGRDLPSFPRAPHLGKQAFFSSELPRNRDTSQDVVTVNPPAYYSGTTGSLPTREPSEETKGILARLAVSVKDMESRGYKSGANQYLEGRRADGSPSVSGDDPSKISYHYVDAPEGAGTSRGFGGPGKIMNPDVPLGAVNGSDAPQPERKVHNIAGVDYMHPEEFMARKKAGKKVPNYRVKNAADGSLTYVTEKVAVPGSKKKIEVPKDYTVKPQEYSR